MLKKAALHGSSIVHRHALVAVAEVRFLEELYPIRTQAASLDTAADEGASVFGLALKVTIPRLEVRSSNVAHRELVQALVYLPSGLRNILELQLRRDGIAELVVAGNLD